MTTEDDFHKALDAQPDDWHARLVLADFLEDRGDPRAAGYRALGARQMLASHANNYNRDTPPQGSRELWWWTTLTGRRNTVPADWYALIEGLEPCDDTFKPRAVSFNCNTRRDAEDAAAKAFGKLPAGRQAELLAEAPLSNPES